ncbi:hypothetical protein FPV67DRAFT_643232 [Lyophyllum atratum]|nr:hypothetical protein FPV67DRAFT_643232 [Lyophyllum atratum]
MRQPLTEVVVALHWMLLALTRHAPYSFMTSSILRSFASETCAEWFQPMCTGSVLDWAEDTNSDSNLSRVSVVDALVCICLCATRGEEPSLGM